MKYFALLIVAVQLVLNADCRPFPGGQIVKYRVPSKFFSKPNATATTDGEGSNDLYSFLTQIHYGGAAAQTIAVNTNDIQSEDVSRDDLSTTEASEAATTEYLETTENVTEQPEQPIDVVKVDGYDGLQALIEKVVNDEIKKLAAGEAITETTTTATSSDEMTTEAAIELQTMGDSEVQTIELDSSAVSDSLLSAVGDLLSSILGLDERVKIDENAIDEKTLVAISENDRNADAPKEPLTTTEEASSEAIEIELGTERAEVEEKPAGYEGEEESKESVAPFKAITPDSRDEVVSEIDLKIENLANAQTSFATESAEQVTETVSNPSESIKREPDVLEVIAETSKPVSFDESISHVMSLVKGSAAPRPMPESILIDQHMKDDVNDLDKIVYGTLKEIEANLGMIHEEPAEFYEHVKASDDSFADWNSSNLRLFVPNSAKAALQYKHEDDFDF